MSNSKIAAFLIGNCFPKGHRPLLVMLEVISTLGAGFVKNLDDAFGVLPDCQPSRGFLNFNVRRFFAGSTSCSAGKKL